MNQLHSERQRYAQDFLRLPFRLDDDRGDNRLSRLDAAVLASEANLLGIRILALEAELGPGRVNELNLLFLGLGTGCRSTGWRRGLLGSRGWSGFRRSLGRGGLGFWC